MVPGDVHLQLETAPHRVFKREGADLSMVLRLTLRQALLGFSRTIRHLDGHSVTIANAGVSQPHQALTLPGLTLNLTLTLTLTLTPTLTRTRTPTLTLALARTRCSRCPTRACPCMACPPSSAACGSSSSSTCPPSSRPRRGSGYGTPRTLPAPRTLRTSRPSPLSFNDRCKSAQVAEPPTPRVHSGVSGG